MGVCKASVTNFTSLRQLMLAYSAPAPSAVARTEANVGIREWPQPVFTHDQARDDSSARV